MRGGPPSRNSNRHFPNQFPSRTLAQLLGSQIPFICLRYPQYPSQGPSKPSAQPLHCRQCQLSHLHRSLQPLQCYWQIPRSTAHRKASNINRSHCSLKTIPTEKPSTHALCALPHHWSQALVLTSIMIIKHIARACVYATAAETLEVDVSVVLD